MVPTHCSLSTTPAYPSPATYRVSSLAFQQSQDQSIGLDKAHLRFPESSQDLTHRDCPGQGLFSSICNVWPAQDQGVVPRQEVPGTLLTLEPPTALYWPQNERKLILLPISQTREAQGTEARTPVPRSLCLFIC